MKSVSMKLLAAALTLGVLATQTANAASHASSKPIRANAQEQFQSDHPARVSALYQENTN